MLGAIEQDEPSVTVGHVEGEEVQKRQQALGATDPDSPQFEEELRRFVNFHSERSPDYLNVDELTSAMEELVFAVYEAEGAPITDPETRTRVSERIAEQVSAAQTGVAHTTPDPAGGGAELAADPVSVFTGEFSHRATDLVVSGAGIDFAFGRTYRNQATYAGPLGPSWDHDYNLWLRVAGDTVFRSTGRMAEEAFVRHPRFDEAGFDYYVPPDGETAILVEEDDGFVLREEDGLRHEFEPSPHGPHRWRLARIVDRFGNFLAFGYDGEWLSEVQVNHPARVVRVASDDCGRISEMSDHTGRVWRYHYDDFGDLVEVMAPATADVPEGGRVCYGYSTVGHTGHLAHNLTEITDGNGCTYLATEYGTVEGRPDYNRVTVQREGNGTTTFDYSDVVFEGDPRYPEYQRPAHQTVIRHRNGREVVEVTNRRGHLLLREECAIGDGLAGGLRWRYRYNEDAQLIAALTPGGSLTQYYYGREEFLRLHELEPGASVKMHDELDASTRQGFMRLLASVERAALVGPETVDLSLGVWGDIFPDVFSVAPGDRVVKWTYESRYGQPLTVSDPRFTASPDPNAEEDADFDRTLSRFHYRGPADDPRRVLDRLEYPTPTLPDGSVGTPVVERWPDHDAHGRPLRYVNTAGTEAVYTYFGAIDGPREGFLERVRVDPGGLDNTTEYLRDDLGRVVGTRLPRSFGPGAVPLVRRFIYNDLDQIEETVSPAPHSIRTRTRYDAAGRRTRIETDALASDGTPIPGGPFTETFGYDQEGHLTRQGVGGADEQRHLVVTHCFDAAGLKTATRWPGGRENRTCYDGRGNAVAHTRGYGTAAASTTRQEFDADGRLSRLIDAEGFAQAFEYDAFHDVVAVIDALGNVARRSYDKAGNMILERVFERGVDATFRLVLRRSFHYDELNRRIRSRQDRLPAPLPATDPESDFIDPLPGVESAGTDTVYDGGGRVVRVIDALGRESTTAYDALDHPIRYVDPLGNRIENRFDAHGNHVRQDFIDHVVDPDTGDEWDEVFSSAAEYDTLDRLVSRTDGMGNVWTVAHDSRNALERQTDPLGNVVLYDTDLFDRRIAERVVHTDTGLGAGTATGEVATRYSWDADGNLVSMTDGLGRVRQWRYDVLGRVTAAIYPDGSRMGYVYDRRDGIARMDEPGGMIRRYRRDALGRVTGITFDRSGLALGVEVAGASFERYAYDALNRRTLAENDFVSCRFSHSSLGLPVEEIQALSHPDAPGAPPLTVARSFDDAGDLVRLTYPGGREVTFDRDALGRVVTVGHAARGDGYPGRDATPDGHQITRCVWAGRRLAALRFPGEAHSRFTTDAAARIIAIDQMAGGVEALRHGQLFDGVGNLRLRQDATPAIETSERYTFDSSYRLADAAPAAPVDVAPGAFAPPGTPAEPIASLQPGMDALVGSMVLPPVPGFEYDAVGNRTIERIPGEPARTYATNELDQYTVVAGVARSHDANGNVVDDGAHGYVYDANGLLTRVIDSASGQEIWRAVHDALGRRVLEIEGGAVRRLVHSAGTLIAEHGAGGPLVHYVAGPSPDRVLQIAAAGEEHSVHTDLVGSTRLLSDPDGNLTAAFQYSPFGQLLDGTPPEGVRILFAGRRMDPTGSYGHGARTYSPDTGRFLQRDPGDLVDGPNLYAYAGNNPLSFADPSGLSREERTTGFFGPRLVNTGRGTGGRGPTLYEDEEGEFVQPGQRGILALDVDPEAEARRAAGLVRKAIAQRRAFDNIERDMLRARNRSATWMAVWAGALVAAPFVIEAGIVSLPFLVRGGGSLTTRVYLGGSTAAAHIGTGVTTFAEGSTLAAVGVTLTEAALGIGGWRTQSSFRRWSLQRENDVIDRRAREVASLPSTDPSRNVRMPPRAPKSDKYRTASVPVRGTNNSVDRNVGAQRVTLDDGTVVIDDVYVSQKGATGATRREGALTHNEQLGIGALDRLTVDPKRVREIWIYTERAPCLHCTRAIQDLEARYPNARIRVADTYGKISWHEHHEEGLSGPM